MYVNNWEFGLASVTLVENSAEYIYFGHLWSTLGNIWVVFHEVVCHIVFASISCFTSSQNLDDFSTSFSDFKFASLNCLMKKILFVSKAYNFRLASRFGEFHPFHRAPNCQHDISSTGARLQDRLKFDQWKRKIL